MKKALIISVTALAAIIATWVLLPKKAECVWCPNYACYGEYSCGQCKCMKQGSSNAGSCVSFQFFEMMKEKGEDVK